MNLLLKSDLISDETRQLPICCPIKLTVFGGVQQTLDAHIISINSLAKAGIHEPLLASPSVCRGGPHRRWFAPLTGVC